jgi:uncharacterized protein (TIGR02145 family)
MKGNLPILVIISIFLASSLSYCRKKPTGVPEVQIDSIDNITIGTADVHGSILDANRGTIIGRGVCWSLHGNPTLVDENINFGSGNGPFNAKISGLSKGLVYYVRAFASNSKGIGYSEQKSVKVGAVTDIDGNEYDVVSINGKTWLASNLRVTRYSNGDPIPLVMASNAWKNLTSGGYCYVNDNEATSGAYGLLYNWYAAFDARGICPKGFRAVIRYDYKSLTNGSAGSGGALKSTGLAYWLPPNVDASNSTGFSARGTGYRDDQGIYHSFNEQTLFWDIDLFQTTSQAYYAMLLNNSGDFLTEFDTKDKNYGICVRCLMK